MNHYKKLLELQSTLHHQVNANHSSIVHFIGVKDPQWIQKNIQLEESFKGLLSNYCLSVEHPNAGHKPTSEQLNTLSYAYHAAKANLLSDKEHLRQLNAPQYALDKVDVEIENLKTWLVAFHQLWQ
jgi:hypothetical protein